MSTQQKTFNELISGDEPVLVDFFATWCGPCQMMQPILMDTAKQVGDKVKIIKVDVDKNQLAASNFQVRGVPTLILFQRGKVLWRQSGVVPAHQLVNVINENLLKVV
ncbi:thioredoxin [Belliella sp. R4-6]|uniref:Thioredoxin n=1 Tax=Belliella alkalica TaxID=1730871 RepID=A0ABS9V8G2_9BACT|nr:thioredoxin [Belliella alkalica]MCH7412715.1 thioredoxin [Belliella alkalica]